MKAGYVHVSDYANVLYVEAMRHGEIAWTNGPPYLRVAKGDGPDAIGRTVREALDASMMLAPFSASPFLEWSRARTWSMFSKRSRLVTVALEGDRILVHAYAADGKGNHLALKDQQMELSAASWGSSLGEAVLKALEWSDAAHQNPPERKSARRKSS